MMKVVFIDNLILKLLYLADISIVFSDPPSHILEHPMEMSARLHLRSSCLSRESSSFMTVYSYWIHVFAVHYNEHIEI